MMECFICKILAKTLPWQSNFAPKSWLVIFCINPVHRQKSSCVTAVMNICPREVSVRVIVVTKIFIVQLCLPKQIRQRPSSQWTFWQLF